MNRKGLFSKICSLIGEPPLASIRACDGWPGVARLEMPGRIVDVALHVSNVSSHSRADYELRFQNPGNRKPVSAPGGAIPVLIGLHSDPRGHVLVGCEGESRLGRDARFSVLFNSRIVDEAHSLGWGRYQSKAGEFIYAFQPSLFPVFLELVGHDVPASVDSGIREIVAASGMLGGGDGEPEERARRASYTLVRKQSFSREVREAYGQACAMCGLGLNLVVGAHIYPVNAPGSPDTVENGLSLCGNHHTMFDMHKLWVNPQTRAIAFHPEILAASSSNNFAKEFVESTFSALSDPLIATVRPAAVMFDKRYEFFEDQYSWAD